MKNSKILIAASIFVIGIVFQGNAQEVKKTKDSDAKFGIKGGVNFSNMYSKNVDDNNVLTGFNAGVFAKLPINEFIAIQPEVSYSTKGAELVYNNAFVSGTAKYHFNYVEVPVLLIINITKNFNIQAGGYAAYLVDAKVTNESSNGNFDFANNINKDDYNRFDYGLASGIGVDVDSFSFGVRYNYGLSRVGKERNYNGTTYTFPDAKNSVLSAYLAFSLN